MVFIIEIIAEILQLVILISVLRYKTKWIMKNIFHFNVFFFVNTRLYYNSSILPHLFFHFDVVICY